MKAKILLTAAALLFGGAASVNAETSASAQTVSIELVNPENFIDLESTHNSKKNARINFTRAITEELERRLRASFGEGATLSMKVTDVDLAGRINPARFTEVRVVKGVWPPRMKFSYVLKGADGAELASGEESLVDIGYLGSGNTQSRREPFRYEREMVKDWLRGLSREIKS